MTTIALPVPCVVVLVGAAGSGKSTLAERLFGPDEVLSSDAFRARIAGDERDQRVTGAAFGAIRRALDRRLVAGLRTVIDATNLSPAERRPWLRAARRHGVPAFAIVLDIAPGTVRAQGMRRTRIVPPPVVERHLAAMGRLRERGLDRLYEEGFDVVLRLADPREVAALSLAATPIDPPDQPPAA